MRYWLSKLEMDGTEESLLSKRLTSKRVFGDVDNTWSSGPSNVFLYAFPAYRLTIPHTDKYYT